MPDKRPFPCSFTYFIKNFHLLYYTGRLWCLRFRSVSENPASEEHSEKRNNLETKNLEPFEILRLYDIPVPSSFILGTRAYLYMPLSA